MARKNSQNSILGVLNNPSLYEVGEASLNRALDVAKTLTDTSYNESINFFVYWIGNDINEKHETAIKSFLTTQDLSICRLIIYSDVNLKGHPILIKLANPSIEARIFDVTEEVKGTLLENCPWNVQIKNHRLNPALESDYFRILMLYKYGGIYADFDIMFLRDLRPLMPYEWVYQWGPEPYRMNGATMRLKKGSPIALEHLNVLIDTHPRFGTLCWASDLYQRVREKYDDLIVFPGAFFNSDWQIPLDGSKFMSKCEDSTKMFEGCFAWHWHNKWYQSVEAGSKFSILQDKINTMYKEKFSCTV